MFCHSKQHVQTFHNNRLDISCTLVHKNQTHGVFSNNSNNPSIKSYNFVSKKPSSFHLHYTYTCSSVRYVNNKEQAEVFTWQSEQMPGNWDSEVTSSGGQNVMKHSHQPQETHSLHFKDIN